MAQYCSYDDLKQWIDDDATGLEPYMVYCIEAASRAVDRATNRQFGLVAAPEVRHFTADYDRQARQWFVDIDDLQTTTGLTIELDNDRDGTAEATVTNYVLTPINAAATGRPWTRIEILPAAPVKPNGVRFGVTVTGRFGWTAVPSTIRVATLLQASRLFARRESQSGPLSNLKVDDVAYAWAAADLDTDVAAAVAPYVRWWGAA
jgi:hypothetical protein